MWQQFSEAARRAILSAQGIARGHDAPVDIGFVLWGVLLTPGSASVLLRERGITPESPGAKRWLDSYLMAHGGPPREGEASRPRPAFAPPIPEPHGTSQQSSPQSEPLLTRRSARVLELAADEARRAHSSFIGTGHLLLGILRQQDSSPAAWLHAQNVTLETLRLEVARERGGADLAAFPTAEAAPAFTLDSPDARLNAICFFASLLCWFPLLLDAQRRLPPGSVADAVRATALIGCVISLLGGFVTVGLLLLSRSERVKSAGLFWVLGIIAAACGFSLLSR